MGRPTTKAELTAAASAEFARLWEAVATVPPDARERPGACERWTVKDLLAHLDAWHELVLGWQHSADAGNQPAIPAPGCSWRDTPALNEQIRAAHADDPWAQVERRLRASHQELLDLADRYGDDDLFAKGRYPWTGSTSVGAYLVSATSSHYAWATTQVRRWVRAGTPPPA